MNRSLLKVLALCAAGAPGLALAQPAAWYEIQIADPLLAPGESTLVTVRGRFTPGLGSMIILGGNPVGIASGLADGGFDIAIDNAAGGSFSLPTLVYPFNLPLGTSTGTVVPGGVQGVLWGMAPFFVCPNPVAAHDAVWESVLTADRTPGQYTLHLEATLPFEVWTNWYPPVPCSLSVVVMPNAPTAPAGLTVTACYPDCDSSGALTVADFACFQASFVAGQPYADCDGNTQLTIADFACFQTAFVAGCP